MPRRGSVTEWRFHVVGKLVAAGDIEEVEFIAENKQTKAEHAAEAKKVLDFVLSDEGQAIWADAFLRPVRANAMSKEAAAKFLPAADYARTKPVNYAKMADAHKAFSDRYLKEVQ